MTVPDDDRPPGHFGPRDGDDQSAYGYGWRAHPGPNWDQPTVRTHSPTPDRPADQPERGRRGGLVVLLGTIGLVAVLGTVVVVVYLTRTPAVNASAGSSSVTSVPATSPPAATTTPAASSGGADVPNDQSGITYRVPSGWTAHPTLTMTADSLPGITLRGLATRGSYSCEAKDFVRGWAGSVRITKHRSPEQAAVDFAKAFTAESYPAAGGDGAKPSAHRKVTINGRSASRVDTTVALPGTNCAAAAGRVITLVFEDKVDYQVFVVSGDTDGGIAVPAPVDAQELEVIATSVRG